MAGHAHDEADLEYTAKTHVGYELRMMAAMAVSRVVDSGGDVAATALFESTLTHLRNLDEFITTPPPVGRARVWEQQVCAHHYLGSSWTPIEGLPEPTYRAITRKVSHVYCDRADPAYTWSAAEAPMVPTGLAMVACFDEFLGRLAGTDLRHRRTWFEPAVEEARQTLTDSPKGLFVFARR